jgi:hypothetical protein
MVINLMLKSFRSQLVQFYHTQQLQKTLKLILGLILCLGAISIPSTIANASDLSRQPITEISVNLGSETGELKFSPNQLQFELSLIHI